MAFKISVVDRVSTYPGRVTLTPVGDNTYDMVRADMPTEEGTLINAALFGSKADTLTEDVVVYVATNGSDVDGDGSVESPFLTIQAAVDALPKHLGGHTAEIYVDFGVYDERVSVVGFSGGKLIIGRPGNVFTINGIEINSCTYVETNIYQIEYKQTGTKGLFDVSGGSTVMIKSDMIINGISAAGTGIRAIDGGVVATEETIKVTINNCAAAAQATKCAFISFGTLTGSGNTFGVLAYRGSIISYATDTLQKAWSHDANSGGMVLTGSNSTNLSGATIEL